jgi:cytochrome d ubiquinol oxidase subunit II
MLFSALYASLLLLLFALIFHAASFEFSAKVDSDVWRALWDIVHWRAKQSFLLEPQGSYFSLFFGRHAEINNNAVYLLVVTVYGVHG